MCGLARFNCRPAVLDIGARLSEHDEQLRQIFEALRQLITPPPLGRSAPSGSEFARATSSRVGDQCLHAVQMPSS